MQEQEIVKYLQNSPYSMVDGVLKYTGPNTMFETNFDFNNNIFTLIRKHVMPEREKVYIIPLEDVTKLLLAHKDRTLIISMKYRDRPRKFSVKLKYNVLETPRRKKLFLDGLTSRGFEKTEGLTDMPRSTIYWSPQIQTFGFLVSEDNPWWMVVYKFDKEMKVKSRFHIYYEDIKSLTGDSETMDLEYFVGEVKHIIIKNEGV